jgi:DNA-3-methyladenine glycosylase I
MTTDEHRAPWDCVFAKENEGTCLPGTPPDSDQEHFEILCLCILQAGLNWGSIRKHWPRYKEGFLGFDINRLAESSPEQVLANPGVIRNGRKVAAIVENAREFLRIAEEFGSFSGYLAALGAVPEQEQLKTVMKRFRQVGPETADYFLHSVGCGSV